MRYFVILLLLIPTLAFAEVITGAGDPTKGSGVKTGTVDPTFLKGKSVDKVGGAVDPSEDARIKDNSIVVCEYLAGKDEKNPSWSSKYALPSSLLKCREEFDESFGKFPSKYVQKTHVSTLSGLYIFHYTLIQVIETKKGSLYYLHRIISNPK